MAIQLDHLIVPALDKLRSAQLLAGILDVPWSGSPTGPIDMKVNTEHGGRIVYWSEPDGHAWEILTQSYARQPAA